MAMKQQVVTTYECDSCGREYKDPYAHGPSVSARLQISGRAYDGAEGGGTVTEWWCGLCVQAIEQAKKRQRERYGNA